MPGIELEREIQKELEEWEMELYCRNRKRMYKTEKNYRDPRKEVMKDYRHHRKTKWFYDHECRYVKKQTSKKLRRKLKREIFNEAYDHVIPHDYKTYGWITW